MTITCPRCYRGLVATVTAQQYEVRITCPNCGQSIVIEVGTPQAVGPTEHKERQC